MQVFIDSKRPSGPVIRRKECGLALVGCHHRLERQVNSSSCLTAALLPPHLSLSIDVSRSRAGSVAVVHLHAD